MGAVGIIVEYNPMHNGHIFHLQEAIKIANGKPIVAVMSGNFVQRGELSVLDKYQKARLALEEGVDIVVELPFFYSTQSAEIFSIGAMKILSELGVNTVVFGSEENNTEKLILNVKRIIECETEIGEFIKKSSKSGTSYPNSIVAAYKENKIELDLKPNTILGIEYIKTILKNQFNIMPVAIKRKNTGYFDEGEIENIASASYIRKLMKAGEVDKIKPLVSFSCFEMLKTESIIGLESLYDMLYYALSHEEKLNTIQDMEVGLEYRLKKMSKICYNYNEYFNSILCKRYTFSRMQRVLLHILLGVDIHMTEYVKENLPYIQILGASKNGRTYLKNVQELVSVNIITNIRNKEKLTEKNRQLFEKALENDNLYAFKRKKKIINIPVMF
ncbi:MAG: nucleotidyltransferase [Fusobacteria bacterium]|nr:nucleotidyltransferase [Fusobacteriota bacterium]